MNLYIYLKELKERFDMEKAVCNHGFFMMAPNVWNPLTKKLHRPLTISDSSSTDVIISHPGTHNFLVVEVPNINNVSRGDSELIEKKVRRMLRLSNKEDQDLIEFNQLHEEAMKSGFGRIFRSPSLFEDMVKCILLCNLTWEKTLTMASSLCDLRAKLADGTVKPRSSLSSSKKKRKRRRYTESIRNFPSAEEIASLDKEEINEHCKLGYRAAWIIALAKLFEKGSLDDLEEMEAEQVIRKLKNVKGFGTFATATVLMCLGHYHLVPADTETIRLLKEMHGMKECSKDTIEKTAQSFYDRFAPFQCLAYWYDLIQNYESKVGKLSELRRSDYSKVSGCSHMKQLKVEGVDQ